MGKSIVYCGFTIIIYMFLLFGSSMRKFDESSIRYKIENQVFDFCVFWGRSLATCLSRQFYLSLLAALFSCYMAPFCVFPCLSFLPSSFSFWTISLISYWSLLVAYLFRARLLLFVSPFLSSSSIRIFRSCKLSSPFFSPQFFSFLFYSFLSLWISFFKTSWSPRSSAILFIFTLYSSPSCLLILLDRDHRLSRGLGDYSGVYRRCAGGSAHCVLQNRDA